MLVHLYGARIETWALMSLQQYIINERGSKIETKERGWNNWEISAASEFTFQLALFTSHLTIKTCHNDLCRVETAYQVLDTVFNPA